MKKIVILVAIALVALATNVIAGAHPQGAEGTKGENLGDDSTTEIGAINATGGNINELDLTSNQQTKFWQLFYGNVTGWLQLRDNTENVAYNWGSNAQYVMFATNNSIAWENLASATDADKISEDSAIGKTSSMDVDSVNRTFTSSADGQHSTMTIAQREILENSSPTATPEGEGAWTTVMLTDSTEMIYTVSVAPGQSYNDEPADYQVLLPAPEEGERTYHVFIELS